MLLPIEKISFLLLVLLCLSFAFSGFRRIVRLVRFGQQAIRTDSYFQRLVSALKNVLFQKPVFKARPQIGLFHSFLFFGFLFYLIVNGNDMLVGFVNGWTTIGRPQPVAKLFNLFSDVFSVLVFIGMIFFLVRRFIGKPVVFEFNQNIRLHRRVKTGGIKHDSLIVGLFILLHVGSRWMGTTFYLAEKGLSDSWLPTANALAPVFYGWSGVGIGIHITWWIAMGLIVLFIPYFPYSKHIHLLIAPLNLFFERRSPRGQLNPVTDSSMPGAVKLTDLPWPQILDPYACIMCNRCHEICPAYRSGAPLSPSALEINKRYYINKQIKELVMGLDQQNLLDYTISEAAVWTCSACYACVSICPVGNEPLMDIIELRRNLIFDGQTPAELPKVLQCMDQHGNSVGESSRDRNKWSETLDFTIKDATKEPVKYLWYVGDFASYNCPVTTRKIATVLHTAGVDFGIIGPAEKSAGNDVRRVGEEGLFEILAKQNIDTLKNCAFDEIFTTDPHTFNTLKNEYPALGGQYHVKHYSTLLVELINSGQIRLRKKLNIKVTYHDPCYLGRYNGIYDDPREVLTLCGIEMVEMPRNREMSFCCGAGGGRIWMEDHKNVTRRPGEIRIAEAISMGIKFFTIACPKDMTMFTDAVKTTGNEDKIEVKDLIDYVIEAIDLS